MTLEIFTGAALILAGGILQGTFAVPMKFARQWRHENIWLLFALSGLVLFPWLLTVATVPALGAVYGATSSRTLQAIVLSGLAWGVGATLTGLGLRMAGISLGLAIILGLSASVGSLIPLLALTPEKILTPQGHLYLAGTCVMMLGLVLVALAGSLREKAQAQTGDHTKASFKAGLWVCIAAGVLSSTLNFAYAFGAEAIETASRMGTSPVWASNVVAAPATTGGFLANLVFCVWQLKKNRSTALFRKPGTASHWLYGVLMGAFWFGGLAVYGMGVYRMGSFGTVVGWPLLMGTIIVSSNVAGLLTGEWTGAPPRARRYLFLGGFAILVALGVLAMAQRA